MKITRFTGSMMTADISVCLKISQFKHGLQVSCSTAWPLSDTEVIVKYSNTSDGRRSLLNNVSISINLYLFYKDIFRTQDFTGEQFCVLCRATGI